MSFLLRPNSLLKCVSGVATTRSLILFFLIFKFCLASLKRPLLGRNVIFLSHCLREIFSCLLWYAVSQTVRNLITVWFSSWCSFPHQQGGIASSHFLVEVPQGPEDQLWSDHLALDTDTYWHCLQWEAMCNSSKLSSSSFPCRCNSRTQSGMCPSRQETEA